MVLGSASHPLGYYTQHMHAAPEKSPLHARCMFVDGVVRLVTVQVCSSAAQPCNQVQSCGAALAACSHPTGQWLGHVCTVLQWWGGAVGHGAHPCMKGGMLLGARCMGMSDTVDSQWRAFMRSPSVVVGAVMGSVCLTCVWHLVKHACAVHSVNMAAVGLAHRRCRLLKCMGWQDNSLDGEGSTICGLPPSECGGPLGGVALCALQCFLSRAGGRQAACLAVLRVRQACIGAGWQAHVLLFVSGSIE